MEELFHAFGIEWQLLAAQVVNFGIVVAALTYFLYKPLMKVLTERQAKIAQGVKDAEAVAQEKTVVASQKAGIIAKAEQDAAGIVDRAAVQAKEERAGILRAAQERAEGVLRDADLQSEALKEAALKESREEIARTAILAAEKILATKH